MTSPRSASEWLICHTQVSPLQGQYHKRPSTARALALAPVPHQVRPPSSPAPVGPPTPRRPNAQPGFRALTTVVAVARGEMAQPARYGLQGTADPTTRKAGAASGTQARPASQARPAAGRQAPETRQQVNSARPRPTAHRPAFVRAARRRPRVPGPCGSLDTGRALGGLGAVGARARGDGGPVPGCP